MHELFFGHKARYTLKQGPLTFIESEIYKLTVDASKKMVGGIDNAFCLGNKKHCPSLFRKAVSWATKVHAQSRCANRNITAVEDNEGLVHFYTIAH
jgi:hypothetical protein